MTSVNLTLPLAFLAGFLSFISPCVLPLAPVYLGYLTGSVVTEKFASPRRVAFSHALFFVLGFSLIFVLAFGVPVGLLGRMMAQMTSGLVKIGGALLLLFDLHISGWIHVPLLVMEGQRKWGIGQDASYVRSFLIGMTFAASWMPCVGPLLGAILTLTLDARSLGRALVFLAAYSVELGLPFLVVALLLTAVAERLHRWSQYLCFAPFASGLFLIIMGLLC